VEIDLDPRSPQAQKARETAHRLLASRLGDHPEFSFKASRIEEAVYLADALATIAHVLTIAIVSEETAPLLDRFRYDPQGLLNFVESLVDKRIDES
jgi:hypothetical protein